MWLDTNELKIDPKGVLTLKKSFWNFLFPFSPNNFSNYENISCYFIKNEFNYNIKTWLMFKPRFYLLYRMTDKLIGPFQNYIAVIMVKLKDFCF